VEEGTVNQTTHSDVFPTTTVFIVDDDDGVRDALTILIGSMGIQVKAFASVQTFLDDYDPGASGCLVLDVRLPRLSGLELQEHLQRHGVRIPIIFISGHGNVAMAVRTLKAGAVDFLEKPFDDQMLLDSIQKAIEMDHKARSNDHWHTKIMERLGALSRREEEVLRMLIQGKSNKMIAHEMDLSTKTVETHRAHIMRKLGVNSMAGLVWMALTSGEYREVPDRLPFPPPATSPQPFALN
jgi:FixJ family two-component response regulator